MSILLGILNSSEFWLIFGLILAVILNLISDILKQWYYSPKLKLIETEILRTNDEIYARLHIKNFGRVTARDCKVRLELRAIGLDNEEFIWETMVPWAPSKNTIMANINVEETAICDLIRIKNNNIFVPTEKGYEIPDNVKAKVKLEYENYKEEHSYLFPLSALKEKKVAAKITITSDNTKPIFKEFEIVPKTP